MSAPLVSVLMPVRNGERFLHDAVSSILAQSWTDYEFVIVDDGSTDATPRLLSSFRDARIRVITNPSSEGVPRALNRGLEAAQGRWIARHDADDVAHPKRLETQLSFLRRNPDVVLLGSQVRLLDARGRASDPPGWRRALTHQGIAFQSLFENPFIHSSVMFRRDLILDGLGGYDPLFVSPEDYDLWSRVAARYEVRNLPERLVLFRMHDGSTAARFGPEHVERSSDVIARNLRNVLGLTDVPHRWCRALANLQIDPAAREPLDGHELLEIFATIHELYLHCHPKPPREVAATLAAKLADVACQLVPSDRDAAFRSVARAWRQDALSARAFATRFAARLVLRR